MGTYAKQGSFTLNTATGNQAITGVGFQPKLVIFWSHQFATVSGSRAVHRFYGAASGSSNQMSFVTSVNQNLGNQSRQIFTDAVIRFNDAANDTAICSAAFVSLDSNGFTVNVTAGAAITVYYLALGGTNFSASVGTFSTPTGISSGYSQSVSGLGFSPKAVMFFSGIQRTDSNFDTADGGDGMSIGFATGSGTAQQESNVHYFQADNLAAKRGNSPGYSILVMSYAGTGLDYMGKLSSLDSTGFTVGFTTAWNGSALKIPYIAFGGSALYQVGAVTEPGSTGNQVTTTTGLKPIAEIFSSIGDVNLGVGGIESDSVFSFGAAVNSTQRAGSCFGIWDGGATSTASGSGTNSTSASMISVTATDGSAIVSSGDVTLQSTDSFTTNWGTVSGRSIRYSYLAISDSKSNPARMMIGLFN